MQCTTVPNPVTTAGSSTSPPCHHHGSQAWEQLWVSGMSGTAATSLSPVTPGDRQDGGLSCQGGPHSSSTAHCNFFSYSPPCLTLAPTSLRFWEQCSPELLSPCAQVSWQSWDSSVPSVAGLCRAPLCQHHALGSTSQFILAQEAEFHRE